jgi:hypothetical protein
MTHLKFSNVPKYKPRDRQPKARLASKSSLELNLVTQVEGASQSTSRAAGSMSNVNVSQKMATCEEVTHVEIPREINKATVNSTAEMADRRDVCSELSLPTFFDCNKQSADTFLRELDMYFEFKNVPENLKLPIVLRSIKDPFPQNWVSSEYHKLDSYQRFKSQFARLFWNKFEQAGVRCDIYQGKYDKNEGEYMAEHYVRFASLAAYLQPPLSEFD